VTFRGEIYKFINFRRVPLAEIYCLIFENFRITYTSGTGESSTEAKSVCGGVEIGGVEIGGVAVLPASYLGVDPPPMLVRRVSILQLARRSQGTCEICATIGPDYAR
jgi:hypothetical protein